MLKTLACLIVCISISLVLAGNGGDRDDDDKGCASGFLGFGIVAANGSRVSSQLIKVDAKSGKITPQGNAALAEVNQYCNNDVGYLDNRLRGWILSTKNLITLSQAGAVVSTKAYSTGGTLRVHNSHYDKYDEEFVAIISNNQTSYQFVTISPSAKVTLGAKMNYPIDSCVAGFDHRRDLYYVSMNTDSIYALNRNNGQIQSSYRFKNALEFATNILVDCDGDVFVSTLDKAGKARVYRCENNFSQGTLTCGSVVTQSGTFNTIFAYAALIDENIYYTFNWNLKGDSKLYGFKTNNAAVKTNVNLPMLSTRYPFGVYNMLALE